MTTTTPSPKHLGTLRTMALATAVLTVGQAALGLLLLFTEVDMYDVHGWIGYATFGCAVAAAAAAIATSAADPAA